MSYRRNLKGMKFGRLVAIEPTLLRKDSKVIWRCLCDCGNECLVVARSLTLGHTKSCGCLKKELLQAGMTKLGKGVANFNQLLAGYKRGANVRNMLFSMSESDFYTLTQQNCYYCGIEPRQIFNKSTLYGEFIYNGVDRLNPNTGYTVDNCVPCCCFCNRAKRDYSEEYFIEKIKQIYENRILNTT